MLVVTSCAVSHSLLTSITITIQRGLIDSPACLSRTCHWTSCCTSGKRDELGFSNTLLTLIRSTSHRPLPQYLFERLLQTQKNLQHLEILPSGAVDAHYDPSTKDNCTTITDCLRRASLEKLQSVRVVPDMSQTAALCSIALQKGSPQAVTSLEVDARDWVGAAHFTHAQHSMAIKDQLVESLFAHLPRSTPGHNGSFDNLTTLVLRDVKLDVSKFTWFTYLSLSKLQHLELRYCKGADVFLLQLTSGPDVPALRTFYHRPRCRRKLPRSFNPWH